VYGDCAGHSLKYRKNKKKKPAKKGRMAILIHNTTPEAHLCVRQDATPFGAPHGLVRTVNVQFLRIAFLHRFARPKRAPQIHGDDATDT
jgi:hypothetical protein